MNTGTRTLEQWLTHAGSVHRVGIDLGLERVGRVAERIGFEPPGHRPAPRSVIVAGTNGKGSTSIALEALLRCGGLRVGTTLSPHLHVFNERVRVDGVMADDATLCAAFAVVEEARGDIPLTYFEFATLVALHCFREAAVDVAVLEVGLGGRLDAFNLVDADVAVITSIGLDHQAYLGDDLEGIGREKAGVLRPGQRVVLGADVTDSVVQAAQDLGCASVRLGVDFHVRQHAETWDWLGARTPEVEQIPLGPLAPDNGAIALEAAAWLDALPADVAAALGRAELPGRMESWRLGNDTLLVLDVAHNPAGAAFLARQLGLRHPERRFVAVLGMLADKDAIGVVDALSHRADRWICVSTRGQRGLSASDLAGRLGAWHAEPVDGGSDDQVGEVVQALDQAFSACEPGDGILAFGSFDLVERMRDVLLKGHAGARPVAPVGLRRENRR